MESKQGRVLAYSMAKVIELGDLSEVSGGAHVTQRMSLRPSGHSEQGPDSSLDVVIDW